MDELVFRAWVGGGYGPPELVGGGMFPDDAEALWRQIHESVDPNVSC